MTAHRAVNCGLAALLLGVFLGPAAASAAIVPFSSRTVFNAAVDADPFLNKTVETYEGPAAGTLVTTLNGITYTPSVETAVITDVFLCLTCPNTLGRTPLDYYFETDTLLIAFGFPILAFGISFNTDATAAGAFLLTNNLGDVSPSAFDPYPAATTGQFAGFISDTPFTSVTISPGTGAMTYNLDDLTYAVVPLPAALPLFGAALAGLGALRLNWRRRAKG